MSGSANRIAEMLGRPQIERLKQIGKGLQIARVCGDRLLIELVTPETEMDKAEQTSGLVIPAHIKKSYTPDSTTGVIVQVGDGVTDSFAEGQMVLFNRFNGTKLFIDEYDGLKILEAREILCVLERTEDSKVVIAPIREGNDG